MRFIWILLASALPLMAVGNRPGGTASPILGYPFDSGGGTGVIGGGGGTSFYNPPASSAGSTPSTLLTGLRGYWAMEGASGATETDLSGTGNDLTDNNTVGSAPGKVNNCRTFGSTKALSHLDTDSLSFLSTDFTIFLWCYQTSDSGSGDLIGKYNGTNSNAEYTLETDGSNHLVWLRSPDGTVGVNYVITTDTIVNNTWCCVQARFTLSTHTVGCTINSGTEATAVVGAGNGFNGSAKFSISGRNDLTTGWFLGNEDEVGMWSRLLTASEVTTLRGGVTYPAFAFRPDLWWKFMVLVTQHKLPLNKFWRETKAIEWKTKKFDA